MGQKYAAYAASGAIIAFYDSNDSPVPSGLIDVIAITDSQWRACLETPGWSVQAGVLVAPPAPPAADLLVVAQASQTQALCVACQSAIYAGFTSSALGATYTYPATDTDQRNLIASVTASLLPNLPSTWTTPFWCADSTGAWAMREHTAAQIQKAGLDGQAAITALRLQNAKLAAEVMAATTVDAVQAVTWAAP